MIFPAETAQNFAWRVTQLLLAALFATAGGMKLAGAPSMIETFDSIGMGQWLRYVTGIVELAGGLALLLPVLAPFAAVVLAATMVGATLAHLFVLPGAPLLAIVLFALCALIAWKGRDHILRQVAAGLRGARG